MNGIYCYRDICNHNKIVYVGLDSNIKNNSRSKDHVKPSHYKYQQINRVLQNNPQRYRYEVLKKWNKDEYNSYLANALEIIYIKRYNPKFNYTIGGEGIRGYKHSPETRNKISKSLKGKYTGEKHPRYRKHLSDDYKKKISNSLKGRFSGEESPHYREDVPPSEQLYLENKNGLSQRKIAKKYNCSQTLVFERIKKYKERNGL